MKADNAVVHRNRQDGPDDQLLRAAEGGHVPRAAGPNGLDGHVAMSVGQEAACNQNHRRLREPPSRRLSFHAEEKLFLESQVRCHRSFISLEDES